MGDNITKPDHYCDGRKYEPKDVIRDWGLNFNLGSAVKYISRAGRKGDKLEDLKKAKQFLEFEIEAEENESKNETKNYVDLESYVRMVLDSSLDIENDFRYEKTREKIIDRIVEMIDKGDLDYIDIPLHLSRNYQEIKNAIERKTSWYINGIFGQWYFYQNIPDGYKSRVIDKIAQEVLNNQCAIDQKIPTDEVRAAVIDRIVEMVRNSELDLMDIPDDVYDECVRSQATVANREYCKAMDAVRKYAEDTIQQNDNGLSLTDIINMVMKHNNIPEPDVINLHFKFEDDPSTIGTNTVSIKFHTNRKEI